MNTKAVPNLLLLLRYIEEAFDFGRTMFSLSTLLERERFSLTDGCGRAALGCHGIVLLGEVEVHHLVVGLLVLHTHGLLEPAHYR